MSEKKMPHPSELEKELNDYLSKKYGNRVRLSVPLFVPNGDVLHIQGKKKKKQQPRGGICFDMKPQELEAYLNEYVIKQSRAKEILATKICTHFNRIKQRSTLTGTGNIKNNILMIGPTGVGKTFLIKLIADKLGVPFIKGDATKFSETGYVGGDVEDLVRDLVREAGGDIEKAQCGIIYIDEIDKIAGSKYQFGNDVSRTGVQRALLKPMEETEVDLRVPHDVISQMEAVEHYRRTGKRDRRVVNTRNILFIMSGAFNDLEDIIAKRLYKQAIGFASDIKTQHGTASLLERVKAEDLVEYGFESEFIGRLPVIATFSPLNAEDLYCILKNSNSAVITSKKRDFMAYGIDVRFEDAALKDIALMAAEEKTGARGLISAVERVLLCYEKMLPSTDIKTLVVTRDVVEDPLRQLEKTVARDNTVARNAAHQSLIQQEARQLKRYLGTLKQRVDASVRFLLEENYIDTIVKLTIEKYFDYHSVLQDALGVVSGAKAFEKSFREKYKLTIRFDDSALNCLINKVLMDDLEVEEFVRVQLKNYEHGLKLLQERTGQTTFVLSAQSLESPAEFLNTLVHTSYS